LRYFLITTINTDSWSLNYTDYYNGTIINQLVASNDTWRTNYSDYYTKTELTNGTWTYYGDEDWINKNSTNALFLMILN